MERRIPSCAFLLWCLWWRSVEGVTVPAPTNVTLHCHNMQNSLMWEYDHPSEGVSFNVVVSAIIGEPVQRTVDSPAMSINLDEFSDPTNEYMVKVSAVKDNVKSEEMPVDGIEYSYFKDALTTVICKVDLPSVNVTTEENHLHHSFTHPGLLYFTNHKLRKKKKKSLESHADLPEFAYHIEVIDQNESHPYYCSDAVCQGRLPVHDKEKTYCLNITGEMNKISVQATKKYCSVPMKSAGINALAYILPMLILLVGGLLIAIVVITKKIKANSFHPRSLTFLTGRGSQQNGGLPMPQEYSPVDVGPYSPSPLIPPEQESSHHSSTAAYDIRLPLGIPDNQNEQELDEAAGEQGGVDEGYTDGKYLEEEEENARSQYEPHSLALVNDEPNDRQ